MPHLGIKLLPLKLSSEASEVDFGAEVQGIDLAKITEEFTVLQDAVYKYLVVVVPGQGHLTPLQQLHLSKLFDPGAEDYGHGSDLALMRASALQNDLIPIPLATQVKLLGNGFVAEHDDGRLRNVTLRHPMHNTFHKDPLRIGDFHNTRFYRWHMDAALYCFQPPKVTTLLCIQVPGGGRQLVRYDDGSGDVLEVPLASTAFVSGEYAFKTLTPEAKAFALQTKIRYHAHPYIWMKDAKALSTGLGLVSEDKEVPDCSLPAWSEEHVCILPAVWKNPITGALALQVHPCCVEDLIVGGKSLGGRSGGDGLARVRRLVNDLVRPSIAPSRVLAHEWKAGDMVIFNNRAVLHTVTGTLKPTDVRIFHQCNLAGTDAPQWPSEEEIDAILAAEGISRYEGLAAFMQGM